MSSDSEALLTAINISATEASAHYQAALVSSQNAAKATVDAMTLRTQADIEIAQIDSGWHFQVATTEADAQKYVADKNHDAAVETATIDANARISTANRSAQATEHAADKDAEATKEAAKTRADADKQVALTDASWRTAVAQIEATATTTAATTGANAEVQSAQAHANATLGAAQAAAGATVQAAEIDASWHANVATIEGTFRVQTASIDAGWHQGVAETEAGATRYSADKQLAGVVAHETGETGRLGTKLAFAQNIYNDIKPMIQQIINNITAPGGILGGGGFNPTGTFTADATPEARRPMGFNMSMGPSSAVVGDSLGFGAVRPLVMGPLDPPQDGGTGGGGSTGATGTIAAPYIATRGVFTPAQLQQQVNAAYSRNDARTTTQIRQAQGDLAGRGFSSNSPILDALRVGFITSNLRASIEAGSQIRLQAAQANVDSVFRGQQARSEQYIGQEKVVLEAQHNQIEQTVGVLNAVANLVGGIL